MSETEDIISSEKKKAKKGRLFLEEIYER